MSKHNSVGKRTETLSVRNTVVGGMFHLLICEKSSDDRHNVRILEYCEIGKNGLLNVFSFMSVFLFFFQTSSVKFYRKLAQQTNNKKPCKLFRES